MASKLCLLLAGALLLGVSAETSARKFHRHWSGTGLLVLSDGAERLLTDSTGRGTFGGARARAVLESVFTGSCEDTGIELTYILATNVVRFASGELLYRTISSGPPSTACFHPDTLTATATIHMDIVGGTGRFEKASGYVTQNTEVKILDGMTAAVTEEVGEIFGLHRAR